MKNRVKVVTGLGLLAGLIALGLWYPHPTPHEQITLGTSPLGSAPNLLVRATRLSMIEGMPAAGPSNSDCQVYVYSGGTAAINCPLQFIPVTGTHTVQQNEWGSVLVASGGGTVTITLPPTTSAGRNVVGFATDGQTALMLTPGAPATLQGSSLIQPDGTLLAPANSSGYAALAAPNLFQVSFR